MRDLRKLVVACFPVAAAVIGSCGFGELFSSAGPGVVQFVWVGDTVLYIDSAVPLQVTLTIDGAPAATPEVHITIPAADPQVLAFGATEDSIVGLRPGFGDVVAWIESSLLPRVDTVFTIRSRP